LLKRRRKRKKRKTAGVVLCALSLTKQKWILVRCVVSYTNLLMKHRRKDKNWKKLLRKKHRRKKNNRRKKLKNRHNLRNSVKL